ncbi:hypothetical protein [Nostoc sp. LPT]|uniref:VMAP-C domain-containing protein n=1 Tax=Nostoc sp. LPT TaxID=2815387 RepID=UPI001D376450|nr:hypothetical protein [Nostoc sp. LPT]MBN4005428.1 hypothetical protein [Nostoc sp. LPT]
MLKVLLVSADSQENHTLRLNQEFRRINNKLDNNQNNQFDSKVLLSTTYEDLRQTLLSYKPSIIHFSCHGMGEQGLVLVDSNEKKEIIHTKTLAELLGTCQKENQNICCVIFNACYGEFQALEIKEHIRYAIGMNNEIKDTHAISFAEAFYEALFLGTTIETAFELGCNSIRRFINNNSNTGSRAEYDPAPDDKRASEPIPDYEIPRLIVNEALEDVNNLARGISRQQRIISYQQWYEFELILLTIDFNILKNVCIDILKQSVQDIQPTILRLEGLLDIKELFLEKYPIRKDNGIFTIWDFAIRLTKEEISINQKLDLKNWLDKTTKEKNIDLSILLEKTVINRPSHTSLNPHLLISILENTGLSNSFSLKAELIANYQEGEPYDQSIPITSKQEGVNAISSEEIEPCIRDLISVAINQLSGKDNLIIELFVPFSFLGEDFDLYKIKRIGSRREEKFRIGFQYQLIIRCLDRYEDEILFRRLETRCNNIREYLVKDTNKKYLEEKCDYLEAINQNWDELSKNWEDDDFFSINLIDRLPVNDEEKIAYFDCFQLSGVPISLWSRSSKIKYDINEHDCNIKDKFKEILAIQCFNNLGEISQKIYQLRRDAPLDENKAKDYLGYHLGFICDRPDPIPFYLRERLRKPSNQASNQGGLQGPN